VVDPFAIRSAPTAALPLPRYQYVYPGTAVERPYSKHAWRRGRARGQGENNREVFAFLPWGPSEAALAHARESPGDSSLPRGLPPFCPFAPTHSLTRS
jgi:hypothetical protein